MVGDGGTPTTPPHGAAPVAPSQHPPGCRCPSCEHAEVMAALLQNQFPAMSPEGGAAAATAAPEERECPLFAHYEFCPHSVTCMMRHVRRGKAAERRLSKPVMPAPPAGGHTPCAFASHEQLNAVVNLHWTARAAAAAGATATEQESQKTPPFAIDAGISRLTDLVAEHDRGVFNCGICGARDIGPPPGSLSLFVDAVAGVRCPQCLQGLFALASVALTEAMLVEAADDYDRFMDLYASTRAALPAAARCGFSAEVHRIATGYFGWCVFGRADAEALAATLSALRVRRVVSIGAGTGYVESAIERAGQAAGAPLAVAAYDEIIRPAYFGVPVRQATPDDFLDEDRAIAAGGAGGDTMLMAADAHSMAMEHYHSALLLSWPPYGGPGNETVCMASDALARFLACGGRVVVYIGDVASTGDPTFHQALQANFAPAKGFRVRRELRRWNPADFGLVYAGQDSMGVYVRR